MVYQGGQIRISFDPYIFWPVSNDILKFMSEGLFTEGLTCCALVLHPVHENLLFGSNEQL